MLYSIEIHDKNALTNRNPRTGHSGSSGDLACHTCSETMQRAKRDCGPAAITRNGSFNVADRRRRADHLVHPERNWIESLRSADKRAFGVGGVTVDKARQYQQASSAAAALPGAVVSAFEQQQQQQSGFDVVQLERSEQKKSSGGSSTKGLRNFFGNKSPQKPGSDLPREPQKTLLGKDRRRCSGVFGILMVFGDGIF